MLYVCYFLFTYSDGPLQEKIEKFIEHLDKEMDLVMITDRMDESLVLLKEKLGWNLTDILYLKRMVAKKDERKLKPLSNSTINRILDRQIADRQLFNYFNKKFDQQIDELGRDRFEKQVKHFQDLRLRFENKCFNKSHIIGSVMRTQTWALSEYASKNLACEFLQSRDILLTRAITQIQKTHDYTKQLGNEKMIFQEMFQKIQSDFDSGIPAFDEEIR